MVVTRLLRVASRAQPSARSEVTSALFRAPVRAGRRCVNVRVLAGYHVTLEQSSALRTDDPIRRAIWFSRCRDAASRTREGRSSETGIGHRTCLTSSDAQSTHRNHFLRLSRYQKHLISSMDSQMYDISALFRTNTRARVRGCAVDTRQTCARPDPARFQRTDPA